MFNLTDFIIFASMAVFFWIGWCRGFLRTVFGPIALIIASIISYQYFIKTHNLIMSLVIAVIGPFVLNLILRFLIKIKAATEKKEDRFPVGRWVGGILSMLWEGSMVILTVLLIGFLPSLPGIAKIQSNITGSKTFRIVKKQIDKVFPTSSFDIQNTLQKTQNPETAKMIQESQEYKDLMGNPKMKKLFSDDKLIGQIQNRDLATLINNPDFQQILQDPELIKKFMALHQKISGSNLPAE